MKKFLIASLGLVIVGCSGNGDTGVAAGNPFAGTYDGSFQVVGGDNGTFHMMVLPTGTASGTVNDLTTGKSGQFVGQISNTGTVALSGTFANGAIVQFNGPVALNSGHMTGALSETGAATQTVNIDLTQSK
jgi:hypothetical protein